MAQAQCSPVDKGNSDSPQLSSQPEVGKELQLFADGPDDGRCTERETPCYASLFIVLDSLRDEAKQERLRQLR